MIDRDEFVQHLAHVANMADMAALLVRQLPDDLPGALSFNPWPHLLSRCHVGVQLSAYSETGPCVDALGRLGAYSASLLIDGFWIRRRIVLPAFQALEVYLLYPAPVAEAVSEDPFAAFIETLDL